MMPLPPGRYSIAVVALALLLGSSAAGMTASADEPPPDLIRDVTPLLTKLGCNSGKCHGSFQGRGGFQLSLLGFDPAFDYEALVKQARGRRINPAAPDLSLMLRKPAGEMPHGGGVRLAKDDDSYRLLRSWIAAGAPPPADPDLHVEQLDITPRELVLQQREAAELRVVAHWSDGVERDVTARALYEIRDETCAEIDPAGQVHALAAGRTAITITYMGQAGAVPVTVPYRSDAAPLEFAANNYIDELVAAEWRKLGLRPAPMADDYEFVRRVHLDLIGTLPTAEEVRTFVASTDSEKRSRLIDELLEREEYVDYWSTRWADLLRVHRRYVGDRGLWSFWGWVRTAVRENWPLDRIARELIASRGSLYDNGATAYYYVDDDAEKLAETTSQLFLGVRLQCARCHHHPYEVWSQEDYYGLANFFTRIEMKDNGDGGRYGGTRLLRPIDRPSKDRRVKMKVEPRLFGRSVDKPADDIREHLAAWIADGENPYFARNFANRYWSYLMGRGLVEPVDDLRATNPASHPDLLDALARDLAEHDFDPKHLLRTICNSRVYQLASEAAPERDADGMFYTHRQFQRLPAAVLLDAVNSACGVSDTFQGLPPGTRAISLPDPAIPSYFLDAFGRSVRANPCECAVTTAPDLAQTLHLINSDGLQKKIANPKGRLAKLLESKADNAGLVETLYMTTLSRPPRDEEMAAACEVLRQAPSRKEAAEDLLWVLLNNTEFVFNH